MRSSGHEANAGPDRCQHPSAPDVSVYASLMSRTNKDIDDKACAAIMKRYQMTAKQDAVDFALRFAASEPCSLEEARGMRGSG